MVLQNAVEAALPSKPTTAGSKRRAEEELATPPPRTGAGFQTRSVPGAPKKKTGDDASVVSVGSN